MRNQKLSRSGAQSDSSPLVLPVVQWEADMPARLFWHLSLRPALRSGFVWLMVVCSVLMLAGLLQYGEGPTGSSVASFMTGPLILGVWLSLFWAIVAERMLPRAGEFRAFAMGSAHARLLVRNVLVIVGALFALVLAIWWSSVHDLLSPWEFLVPVVTFGVVVGSFCVSFLRAMQGDSPGDLQARLQQRAALVEADEAEVTAAEPGVVEPGVGSAGASQVLDQRLGQDTRSIIKASYVGVVMVWLSLAVSDWVGDWLASMLVGGVGAVLFLQLLMVATLLMNCLGEWLAWQGTRAEFGVAVSAWLRRLVVLALGPAVLMGVGVLLVLALRPSALPTVGVDGGWGALLVVFGCVVVFVWALQVCVLGLGAGAAGTAWWLGNRVRPRSVQVATSVHVLLQSVLMFMVIVALVTVTAEVESPLVPEWLGAALTEVGAAVPFVSGLLGSVVVLVMWVSVLSVVLAVVNVVWMRRHVGKADAGRSVDWFGFR